MIYSFGYHRKEIEKLCNTKSKAPNYKFHKLMKYFHKKDPGFSTYKKSIIGFFMKNFNKMNQHDLISILWLFQTHKRVKCTKKIYQRAFISQHDLSARNKFPAIDLEKGLIIDSGASAHMTPF